MYVEHEGSKDAELAQPQKLFLLVSECFEEIFFFPPFFEQEYLLCFGILGAEIKLDVDSSCLEVRFHLFNFIFGCFGDCYSQFLFNFSFLKSINQLYAINCLNIHPEFLLFCQS